MSKTVVVLGATGAQGGSVVDAFLHDQETKWRVRGITRDPTKDAAKALQEKGVEVVKGDIDDIESLHSAFKGANVVFGVTDYPGIIQRELVRQGNDPAILTSDDFHKHVEALETSSGKTLVDAVAAIADTTLERFVWSELPAVKENSQGKYSNVLHFDSKAAVSAYIRSAHPELANKTGFLQLPVYMSNWKWVKAFVPIKADDGIYEFRLTASPDTLFPHVDAHRDTGKFVRALVKAPAGTILVGAGSEVSWREYAALWQKVVGVPARYKVANEEEILAKFPLGIGRNAVEMMLYTDELGWDGGKSNVLRPKDVGLEGQVTTLEQYFATEDWSSVLI